MAREIDTIIVDLQVSNREAVDAIEQATERMAELKKQEEELREEREKGEVTQEQYIKNLTQIREQTEEARQSKQQYTKALKENVKQEKIYADSLNGLRQQLKGLIQQYDNMSKAERDSAKGKELVRHIQQVTDELSKAEQETGRFQRQVGNYEQAIKNLPGKLGEWAMSLNAANKAGGGYAYTMGIMKKASGTFGDTLKLLAKNPFFVVLRVVIGLFTLLRNQIKQNDDAMTALHNVAANFKPILDGIIAAVTAVVKALGALANGITTVIGKMGEWLGLSREGAKANQDLVQSMDALEDKEREYTVESAKRNSEISELRAKSSERDKYTTAERLGFVEQAMRLEKQDLQARRQIAAEKLRLAKLEAEMNKDTSDETKNKLAELEAAMYQAEQAYNEGMRSLNRQRVQFAKEEAAAEQEARQKRQQAAKQAAAARAEAKKKEIEAQRALEDATLALMAEGIEKETKTRQIAYERQKKQLEERIKNEGNMTAKTRELLQQQLTLLEAKYQSDITKIQEKAENERQKMREQIAKQTIENLKLIEEKGAEAAMLRMRNDLQQRLNDAMGNAEKIAEINELEARRELELARTRQKTIQQENYKTIEEYQLALEQAREQVIAAESNVREAIQATQDAMQATKQATFEAATSMADAFTNVAGNVENLFSTLAENDERYADYANAMAYLQILVSTAVSIANAVQGATAAAAATGVAAPFTLPSFIAQMIAIVTGSLAQAASLMAKSSNKPQYATGGVVHGAGTGTSDSVTARVSNGESILTAKATEMFYDQLSAMNVAGGGKPFDKRRGGNRFATGGVVSTSAIMNGRHMADIEDAMRAAVAGIEPVVSVKEITSVQNRVKTKEIIAKS